MLWVRDCVPDREIPDQPPTRKAISLGIFFKESVKSIIFHDVQELVTLCQGGDSREERMME